MVNAVCHGPDAVRCIFLGIAVLAQADSLMQHRSALKGLVFPKETFPSVLLLPLITQRVRGIPFPTRLGGAV